MNFNLFQAQIENKMSTIDNVIEMLTNIIGNDAPPGVEDAQPSEETPRYRKGNSESDHSLNDKSSNDDSEPEKLKTKVIESMRQRSRAKEETVGYV